MDIVAAPKLVLAALAGATLVSSLPRQTPRGDGVMLKLEWVESGDKKRSESVVLRALLDHQTTLRQPNRTITASPLRGENGTGDYSVNLNVATVDNGVSSSLDTQVRLRAEETVVVMGTTNKQGRKAAERLLFMTVTEL